jgi:hypothetical protein
MISSAIPPIAYSPSPEFWALMMLLATSIIKLLMDANKRYQERLDRERKMEEDESIRESARKDMLLVASIAKADREAVESKLKELETAGKDRLKSMLQSNATTRLYTKKAIDTANNTNEKIAVLSQAIVEKNKTPQQVEVINTSEHPVPTTNTP